ncbi:zinc finger protein 385B-like [Callorhinchus milii]|uniref:zinc finger protein 385B-like n=1 Tax=Callorhinchus milii TaxID=7868 RepID=UPI001C3FD375|nr:zinc finger protein 385B-like [Callorhinchus milii]
MLLGGANGFGGLQALVPTPPRLLRSLLDVKPLISFHFDTTSAPVQLFPNFSALEPVQKAIISHTFGVPFSPRKKQAISCHVCQLRFNSQNQAESHYRGNKHARKVKGLESNKMKPITADHRGSDQSITPNPISKTAGTTEQRTDTNTTTNNTPVGSGLILDSGAPDQLPIPGMSESLTVDTGTCREPEEDKAKRLLYCSLCKVVVNSRSQLQAHNTGTKHKALVEAHSGAGPIKVYPRSSRKVKAQTILACGLQEKNFHCQLCDVRVHSDLQLKQHISSRKHKERVGRKTSRSKYNPYSKQHRHIATPMSR